MEAAFQSGFASALLDVLFNKVTDVIVSELKNFADFNVARQKLETTILEAHKLLEEVYTPWCQISKIKKLLEARLDYLIMLCYETEDVMDDIAVGIKKLTMIEKLRNITLPRHIKKLQEKLDHILCELKRYEELTCPSVSKTKRLDGYPYLNLVTHLIGRADDMKAIIQELISCPFNDGVSIIGMHGIGKTTLSQEILKEKEVQKQFLPLWVYVSNGSFNLEEVNDRLGGLLDEQKKAKPQASSSNNVILKKQQKTLLIILDNLVHLSIQSSMGLATLTRSRNIGGSSIEDVNIKFLITTLNPDIPNLTGTSAYYLKRLSDEDCRAVFIENARYYNPRLLDSSLSCIADSIAIISEGLPLVARMLGFMVAVSREDNWANMDVGDFPRFREDILPVLRANYQNMQHNKLISYFSLFPCKYHFNIDDMVHFWVGEGFIQPPRGASSLEQTGNSYVNDLLGRSILQLSNDVTHIGKPRYELHKSSHKFAESISSNICKRLDGGACVSYCLNIDTRHLSLVCCNIDSQLWVEVMKLEGLRTILSLFNNKNGLLGQIPPCLFKKLGRLRVLALNDTDVVELPDSIERLIHLRYLDISNTPIKNLPDALPKLRNLQILKLTNTKNLLHLPKKFQKLTNLLFVDWSVSDISRLNLPSNIGKLSSLQSLPLFPVGDKDGHFITELKNMNQLQASIRITNLENVKNRADAEVSMLYSKSSLKRLELEWTTSENNTVAQDVLEGLKPHNYLKELKVTNYGSTKFPAWMSHPVLMLEKMHLQRCQFCDVLPSLGPLPSLKILVLEEMSDLKHVKRNFYQPTTTDIVRCFPSLELLEFKGLAQLENWTDLDANDMPRLHTLKIVNCPVLSNLPSLDHLSSLARLQIKRCQKLKSLSNLPNSLKSLIIRESDLLIAQCQDGGVNWPKVKHIPYVEIKPSST